MEDTPNRYRPNNRALGQSKQCWIPPVVTDDGTRGSRPRFGFVAVRLKLLVPMALLIQQIPTPLFEYE